MKYLKKTVNCLLTIQNVQNYEVLAVKKNAEFYEHFYQRDMSNFIGVGQSFSACMAGLLMSS